MKRILLSLILISSAFACNAMSNKERFNSLVNLYNKDFQNAHTLRVDRVNTLLADNTFATDNPKALVPFAAHLYKRFVFNEEISPSSMITEIRDNQLKPDQLLSMLAYLRIIEIAYERTSLPDQINIEKVKLMQQTVKDSLKEQGHTVDDSDGSSITSLLFSKKTALAATGLLAAYFGYSYLTKPEKSK